MSRSIILLALLLLVSPRCVGQSAGPKSSADRMRPVKQLPTQTPSSGEIHFESFEFTQLYVTRHPGSWPIKGEPTKGDRFFVEAELYGEEAIDTAKFEAVDEVGNVIQQVLIGRRPDASGRSKFYGVMKVPDRPFRIVISGKGVDGRTYKRTYMKPLTGSIEPRPAEAGSPQIQPHILAYGAGYLYRGGTKYHFSAELVPDYAIQNEKKTKFCIYHQKFKHSPKMQAAWKAILASKAPTKYKLFIDNTDFGGEIAGLHPQGTLFQSFVAEGAQDCGEYPTNRF